MDANSQRQKRQNGTLSSLNTVIEAANLARDISNTTVTKAALGSVSVLLTMIRVRLAFFSDVLFRLHMCPGLQG